MLFSLEIILILALIVLNGYFALSEIALISVKKSRLRHLGKQGNKKAEKALFLARRSSEMLSTIQIAITAIGIFAGAYGGATVAERINEWLSAYPSIADYSEPLSVALVVIPITYLSLIFGELVPKQIALSNPEKWSLRVAGTITKLMTVSAPLVGILTTSTTLLLKLLRIKPAHEQAVSEEEIKLLIAEGTESGTFEKSEQKMVENVFHLGNRPIKDFMTPAKEVVWLDVNDPISVIGKKITGNDRAAYPVCDGSIYKTVGAIEAKDVITHMFNMGLENLNPKDLLQPIMQIDADIPSLVAIERLKKSSVSIALVTEKTTNKVLGVISFHDILEAIVGEFKIEQ